MFGGIDMAKAKNTKTAAKKTAAKNKSNNKELTKAEIQKKKALQGEVLSIILIGLSLIMFICVISSKSMGAFGSVVSSFLIHCFGIGATVLPLVLMVFSIQTLFSDQKSRFKLKLVFFTGFFIVFICLAHIMTLREFKDDTIAYYINYYYEHASLSNGGIIGAILGGMLHSAIGNAGSYIILITALIVLLILATGKSFVSIVTYVGDLIDGVKDDYKDYRENTEYYDEYEEEKPVRKYDDYDDDYDKGKKPKTKKVKKTKQKQEGQISLEDIENKKTPKKKGKKSQPKNKQNNKPESNRVAVFNISEESAEKEEAVDLQNDFILKNNDSYRNPKPVGSNFTGLSELVSDVEKSKQKPESSDIYNLVDDELSEYKKDEEIEDISYDPQQDFVSDVEKSESEDILDTPPWEESDDETAVKALKSIKNKPLPDQPTSYAPGEEPEIISAEKTKNLKKLNVDESLDYKFPKLEFLGKNPKLNAQSSSREMLERAKRLENTLNIFGIDAKVTNISQGPAVTRYEIVPPKGVKVNSIVNLENDIALNMEAQSIRMEAPIPGKAAIGIEIPNDTRSMVYFREVLTNEKFQHFKGKIAFGIGKDITGNVIVQDIAKMPHMLIAGATGSGKSVCINTLITSILYKYTPDQVKLIMVDPKIVELGVYNGIPHLLVPVVTDPQKAAGALNWAVREMMRRYQLFADVGVRNLSGYNEHSDVEEKLPLIVIIIDELADLMMVAKKDVEASIQRLTQLARAAGMHLIIATQRPSVNVITGVIKANVPSRIAFKVSSAVDSRTILDSAGAEKLLGKGDMLLQAGDMDKPLRIQGAFVTDPEVEKIVEYIKVDGSHYDMSVMNALETSSDDESDSNISGGSGDASDNLMDEVISFVVRNGKASTSLIQRKFRIGFNRAARIIDELEERGIVGPDKGGTKGRDVLMDKYEYEDWKNRHDDY